MIDGLNYRMRKVDPSGIITTFAGTGVTGIGGDGGPASIASINTAALGICTDTAGNIYLPDSACSVRKINVSTGIISRYAGVGDLVVSYTGDGIAATNCHIGPVAVAMDNDGNLYIADYPNNRIERVNSSGIIYSVAGTGISGYSGDAGPATAAKISYPENVALDACGNLYIADFNNARVRKVTYPPIITTPSITLSGTTAMPVGSTVTVNATVSSAGSSYDIYWMNHGIEFTTTTIPSVTYTKGPGIDTITARIVPTGYGCWDSTTSAGHMVGVGGSSEYLQPLTIKGVLSVYPNPAHDEVNVTAANKITGITITNLLGQQMSSQQYNSAAVRVDVQGLPVGLYFMKVTDEYGMQTVERIVKE